MFVINLFHKKTNEMLHKTITGNIYDMGSKLEAYIADGWQLVRMFSLSGKIACYITKGP